MQVSAKRAVPVFLCLLALATSARAVPSPWMPLGPFGGGARSLTADPTSSNTVYATTKQGIFKTTNGGSSWITLYTQEATSNLAIDPSHPSTLYVGAPGPLLIKSTDGGASWTPSSSGLPFQEGFAPTSVQIDPANPRRLLVVHLQRLWRSVNAGASWQQVNLHPGSGGFVAVVGAAFAARPAGTAFAATSNGLFRSTDGGSSWTLVGHGLPAVYFNAVVVAPSDPKTVYASASYDGLFRSLDGGFSWQRVAASAARASTALVVSPRSPRTLYGISSRLVLSRSTDGGADWTPLSGVSDVFSVALDPTAPATVYAGIVHLRSFFPHPFAGVFRSDDGGASWTERNQGLTAIPVYSVAVDPSQPDQLWATAFTLLRSANRGIRWVRSPPPPDGPFQVVPGASSELFTAAYHLGGPHGPLFVQIWKTVDGKAWTMLSPGIGVDAFRIAPSDRSTLYVAGPGNDSPDRLSRSTDGGATWEIRNLDPLPFTFVVDLAVAPSSASVLYLWGFLNDPAASQSRLILLRSDDGGATWADVTAGLPAVTTLQRLELAVDPHDPHTVYAGTSEGVWKSTDGGGTWALAGSGLVHRTIDQILSPLPGRLYAIVDGNRIFRSDDGGATWEQRIRGLRTSTVYSLVADPSDPRRIYAATANGVWVLTETD